MATNYYASLYPFCDFAFVSGTELKNDGFFQGFKLHRFSIGKEKVQLLTCGEFDAVTDKLILSGYGIINNKWVNGIKDITKFDERTLQLSKGTFSFALLKEKEISFFTDFFGNGKIFYYEKNGIVVVSSRLHLLMIILKCIGISIQLDYELIGAYFTNFGNLLLQQPLTEDLFYKDVKALNIDKKLVFSAKTSSLEFDTSEYGKILSDKKCGTVSFDSKEYKQLIRNAKTEIISDLNAIFESGKFDHYVCDLTGGKDSRLVLAALSNIDNFANKVKIHNFGEEHERKCVASMMQAYGLRYDPIHLRSSWWDIHTGKDITVNSIEEYFDELTSFHLSTYWDIDTFIGTFNVILDRTIRFSGMSGEILSKHLGYYFPVKNTMFDTVNNAVEQLQTNALTTEYTFKLRKILEASINEVECNNTFIKIKNVMMYRMRTHFSNTADSAKTAIYSPLYSIEAFRAYCYTISNLNFSKVYYDLLYELNPLIACFEFSNASQDNERLSHQEQIMCEEPVYKRIRIKAEADLTEYDNYYKISRQGYFKKTEEQSQTIEKYYQEWFKRPIGDVLYEKILSMLDIMKANVSFEFYSKIACPIEKKLINRQEFANNKNIRFLISVFRRLSYIVEGIKLNYCNINDIKFKNIKYLIYKYEDFVYKEN